MPGVDPLERGKKLDILLKTLMEAGITQPGLAFLLGVNSETLTAYLLRSNEAGALKIAFDADYAADLTEIIEIWPYKTLDQFQSPIPKTIYLKTTRRFLFQISRGADSVTPLVFRLQTQSIFPLGETPVTIHYPSQRNATILIPITLPAGTTMFSTPADPDDGYLIIGANLIPRPPAA